MHPAGGGFTGHTAHSQGQRDPHGGPTTAVMPSTAAPQHTMPAARDLMPPPPAPPQHHHGTHSMPRPHQYVHSADRHQMAAPTFVTQGPTTPAGPQPKVGPSALSGTPVVYPPVSAIPGQPMFIPVYAPGNLNDAVTQTDAPPPVSQQPTLLMPISPISEYLFS